MRKCHQRQILELIKTIKNAQDGKMYAECQEGALYLCDFIDEVFGEGSEVVALLVEYCELLFKAHNGEAVGKWLDEQLVEIENKVKLKLKPTRIEIAFISHKAAQSDSLESIYFAAKADPDCDAFWVPVPYIEHGQDDAVDVTHYEAVGYYDERFELTDYEKYDINNRRPDIIFTFCPYNLGAKIITIHPDYYPEKLREATDMLAYVPYYISYDNVADYNLSAKERKDKFIAEFEKGWYAHLVHPGSINAHKVVLQSENVKWRYQQTFAKTFGEKNVDFDRFVALGSPKIDKVINSRREDFAMPKEWLDIIGDKKVFLYNSSILGFGQGSQDERYIKKITDILLTFMQRDDVVLWWRPHPFLEPMINKFSPMHAEYYRQLVDKFKQGGLGIFDETFDFHRAIAWSDAYYGDKSSLLLLYSFTGKPAMEVDFQISDINTYDNKNGDAVKKGDFGGSVAVKSLFNADYESKNFHLKDFIAFVLSPENSLEAIKERKEAYRLAYTNKDKTAGQAIFEYVKGECL
ncbi:MAG: CDP-glycerol glycerophosphotransferase family protein [Defluviitaleaceae bacterium]|nr:CDP-glycerol glycerophosphotransferase family protein [Defluviitaleaceae bacterium]